MSKDKQATGKKLSLSDLIANAEKIKSKKAEKKDLYIKSLDATITIEKPERSTVLDSYELGEEGSNAYLVYECVVEPNLKDAKLQETFGAKGYEILDKIFDPGEVDSIAKEIVSFAGYGNNSVQVVNEIKN